MSGYETAAKLIPAQDAAVAQDAVRTAGDRLAWPAAAMLVIVVSGGLWYGIAVAVTHLFS